MKRPMCVIGMTVSIAMWAAFLLPQSTVMPLSLCFAATGMLLLLFPRKRLRAVTAVILSAGLALGCYALHAHRQIRPFEELNRTRIVVEGLVEAAESAPNATRYTLLASFPDHLELPRARVRISQYGERDFAVGDTLRCEAVLSHPTEEGIARYYRSRSIVATGYMGKAESAQSEGFSLQRMVLALRSRLIGNLYDNLPPETAASVTGMLMGQTESMKPEDYRALQRSGTAHLLAVSGLHLSVFSGFVLRFLRGFRINRRLEGILTILLSGLFAITVGLTASVVRAFVMVSVVMLGQILSRRADSLNSLGFALLLISLFAPEWLQGMGLWLSVCATAGILLVGAPMADQIKSRLVVSGQLSRRLAETVADGLGITAGAYLFTMPLLLSMSGWLSLTSPLANLAISPFVPGVLLGGILTAVLPASFLPVRICSWITRFCTGMVLGISHFFSRPSFAIVAFDEVWKLLFLLAFLAMLGFLYCRRSQSVIWVVAVTVAVLFWQGTDFAVQRAGENQIELVTVGSDPATLLIRGKRAVLLEVPGPYQAQAVMNYLTFRGVETVDLLVAPGFDGKIRSGLLELHQTFPIGCAIGPSDSYIQNQLARALPGVEVYPSTGAEIEALGGVTLRIDPGTGDILMETGGQRILQSGQGYDIIERYGESAVYLLEGELVLPAGLAPRWNPVGEQVFREKRILLPLNET